MSGARKLQIDVNAIQKTIYKYPEVFTTVCMNIRICTLFYWRYLALCHRHNTDQIIAYMSIIA